MLDGEVHVAASQCDVPSSATQDAAMPFTELHLVELSVFSPVFMWAFVR